jgi:hypothetical protein
MHGGVFVGEDVEHEPIEVLVRVRIEPARFVGIRWDCRWIVVTSRGVISTS